MISKHSGSVVPPWLLENPTRSQSENEDMANLPGLAFIRSHSARAAAAPPGLPKLNYREVRVAPAGPSVIGHPTLEALRAEK